VSAQADTRREAPKEGDFNRPEQAVTEVTFLGRRPMLGLRRPSCYLAYKRSVGAGRHPEAPRGRGRSGAAPLLNRPEQLPRDRIRTYRLRAGTACKP